MTGEREEGGRGGAGPGQERGEGRREGGIGQKYGKQRTRPGSRCTAVTAGQEKGGCTKSLTSTTNPCAHAQQGHKWRGEGGRKMKRGRTEERRLRQVTRCSSTRLAVAATRAATCGTPEQQMNINGYEKREKQVAAEARFRKKNQRRGRRSKRRTEGSGEDNLRGGAGNVGTTGCTEVQSRRHLVAPAPGDSARDNHTRDTTRRQDAHRSCQRGQDTHTHTNRDRDNEGNKEEGRTGEIRVREKTRATAKTKKK